MAGQETTPSSKAAAPPATIGLVNFISEDQLDEVKRTRGERVEDGTAQRDKPLFQVRSPNPLDTPVVLQLMRMRLHDFPCLSFADPTGEQGEEGCGVQRALQTQTSKSFG